MLTAEYLATLPAPILDLYEAYMQSVIEDMARRLARLPMTSTAAWQMQRLSESGKVYEQALKELAAVTGRGEAELKRLFERAGVKALRFDDRVYRAAGLEPLPLHLSPSMAQTLAAGLAKTRGIVHNLTLTTALSGQQSFIRAADLAYLQVSSGAFDYQSALRAAVRQVAADGLPVIQFAGRAEQLDVALRRAVLTGINQTVGQMQERRADEMGADLVQTTAHAGARNKGSGPANHAGWQGKVYSRSGRSGKYPNFVEATGYGTGPGLCGYNCRHSFYPFFAGISENAYNEETRRELAGRSVTYQGRQIDQYDATQIQRGLERKIRTWKRQAGALDAAGLDSSFELEKIRQYQAQMRAFLRQTGLQRQRFREQVFA